ncbi:hypothetical protein [Streptomyces halobius]|uniref:Uncharacterized protein n=1 Tax=Streptomyces halobius TaxID=2879846 RepID=A0ABY4MG62_9ACTN|nr:hypothetical protein [Streptomyces halobius]UQA95699.1 hypothetical protein K9S39_30980 [Streptomyces halobius]
MTIIATGIAALFMAVGFAWPFLPLVVYPFNRWRGMWAAVYCGITGFIAGYVIFRYSHHMTGTFFQASVYTSAARIAVELTGAMERFRRRRPARVRK